MPDEVPAVLYGKYDEYENIINTLEVLISETKDRYFIEMFNELKHEAQDKRDEIQEKMHEEEEKEIFNQNIKFEESRL